MPDILIAVLLVALLAAPALAAEQPVPVGPAPAEALRMLDRGHPRLLLKDADLASMRERYKDDPVFQRFASDVIAEAGDCLARPPLQHRLIGPRLLDVSRECVDRVYALALAWRLTGDDKYAAKAEENLLAVCAFPDWNPSHFLDTAEMSHAVGIGYDWLYSYLKPESRDRIKDGLIRLGLKPGLAAYADRDWWATSPFNWNQVCNSGLSIGALAIAETDPSYAEQLVASAVRNLPLALATYSPDGAWGEGPGYWEYATTYTAYGIAAFDTALGTDFGLPRLQGFSDAGYFPVYTTGPTGMYLCFADAHERAKRSPMPALFWLARKFDNRFMSDADHDLLKSARASAQHLIWYVPPSSSSERETPSLDRLFRGIVEVAVMRSAWNDPDALFVGVKAGYNSVAHGHLDLGSFELDALGVRWARDLGADDYNLPGYWDNEPGGARWKYYRLRAESHNVPLLDGEDQKVEGASKFTRFVSTESASAAVIDFTSAYAPKAARAWRGVRMLDGRRAVLIQDEFDLAQPCEVVWGMTTDAAISIGKPNQAVLSQNGRSLVVRILSPADAVLEVVSAGQAPPEKSNAGVYRLLVRVPKTSGAVRVSVLLAPIWKEGEVIPSPPVVPLAEW